MNRAATTLDVTTADAAAAAVERARVQIEDQIRAHLYTEVEGLMESWHDAGSRTFIRNFTAYDKQVSAVVDSLDDLHRDLLRPAC